VPTKPSNIYQFKITLEDIKPKIWRRIQVPENYNFYDLHIAIQNAMGWEDCHLHQFEMKNPKTGFKVVIGTEECDVLEEKAKIAQYFSLENKTVAYEYDFGDSWHHEIILEKILPAETDVKYPTCLAGQRACPPEDCGGFSGYEYLLEIINDPAHEEYEERMEWLGGGEFDPEDFDPKLVKFKDHK
jgi:hypothetical protein